MPHSKDPRQQKGTDTLVGHDDSATDEPPPATTADNLSADIVAMIFGYFDPADIMCFRRVCTKWRDAAKKTIVPLNSDFFAGQFFINSVDKYNAMRVMTTALPNLASLTILHLQDGGHIFHNGENPDETHGYISLNIGIISRFRMLRCLNIFQAGLNGRYPALFDFPLLQNLNIGNCGYLEFDLESLAGLPVLKQIIFTDLPCLTGNVKSLRALKDTLEVVEFESACENVTGNLMEFADFPRLGQLSLYGTSVIGDVRDIRENDFPKLEGLSLPCGVVGGYGYSFQRISDVPEVMQVVHRLKVRGLLSDENSWELSPASPDQYDEHIQESLYLLPPFNITMVKAGTRRGWRWWGRFQTGTIISHMFDRISACEINWLDQEPDKESSAYENYEQGLQTLEQDINFYRGYLQPPSEDEYIRICMRGA